MAVNLSGRNKIEQNQIYDKLIDGINAVKNATLGGIVSGGGATLVHSSKLLDYVQVDNFDEQMGLKVLQESLKEPFLNILENAGFSGRFQIEELMKTNNWKIGFDVKTGKICDLVENGVTLADY